MKLNTVNVIETVEGDVKSVHSFADDGEGNKQAEELFADLLSEDGNDSENLSFYLDEGCYSSGSYALFLVHSS